MFPCRLWKKEYEEMKTRQEDIKQAIRLAVRKIRSTDIAEETADELLRRLKMITSTVEFVVRDIKTNELCVAIIATFKEIDAERNALKPIAELCVRKLEKGLKKEVSN
jgi:hypothetical protein